MLPRYEAQRSLRAVELSDVRREHALEVTMVVESQGRSGGGIGNWTGFWSEAGRPRWCRLPSSNLRRRAYAWRRFGRGNHPAGSQLRRLFRLRPRPGLVENEPLLFKGNDFARTDIVAA